MSNSSGLTKEQQKELEILAAGIEAEAIQMKIDYEQNPSKEGGNVVVIHENSEYLEGKERGIRMVKNAEKFDKKEE